MELRSYPSELTTMLDGRVALAIELARAAGAKTLEFFRASHLVVHRKQDDSPVTEADRQAETLIRDRLSSELPDDAILGEEFGAAQGDSGYQWIIDPIDGTKSFICGVPLYSTLVAVVRDGRPLGGVIYIPALDELVVAGQGCGAWHSVGGAPPTRCQVSRRRLEDGLFVTSQVDSFWHRGAGPNFHAIERAAFITRTWGDGYGYLLVATGRAEVMIDPVANPWDLAAVQIVVTEAGGRFTSWAGQPDAFGGDGVATNGIVHDQVLSMLQSALD